MSGRLPSVHIVPGLIFGRWKIIARDRKTRQGYFYRCECSCEAKTVRSVAAGHLRSGASQSCGCIRLESIATRANRTREHNAEYHAWFLMVRKCCNPDDRDFPSFGKRGVGVCDRWIAQDGFDAFVADMGPRPDSMVLYRLENDRDFEPLNCRWATRKQQASTRRRPQPTTGGHAYV